MCTVFATYEALERLYCFLHGLFELDWRVEWFVWFDFHYMKLKLFCEAETRQFHRIDYATMKVFQHLVNDRQRFQFIVDQREFVLGTQHFESLVRRCSSLSLVVVRDSDINVHLN
jgi:hypothetical protein